MSGIEFCKQMIKDREEEKTAKQKAEFIEDVSTLGMSTFTRQKPATVYEPAYKFITTNLNLINDKIIYNRCVNSSEVKQLNEIDQPASCYGDIEARCTNKKGELNKECVKIQYEMMDEISNMDLQQINTNVIRNTCQINAAIQVLAEKAKTDEEFVTIALLQEAKDKISNKKPGEFSCENIDVNITKQNFMDSFLRCANKTSVNQVNRALNCNPIVSYQINENNEIKNCLIDTGVLSETKEVPNTPTTIENTIPITTQTSIKTNVPTRLPENNITYDLTNIIIISSIASMVLIILFFLIFL